MPELPEVETMCRGVAPVVGAQVIDVRRPRCARRPISIAPGLTVLRRRIVSQHVAAIERIGKRVLVRFESGDRLMFEPRMTGLVLLGPPPTVEHLRLEVVLRRGRRESTLKYWDRRGLGRVALFDENAFSRWNESTALGPDALAISTDELRGRLAFSSRAIKVALLDQRVLAGVGNLYASELLHVARIDPRQPCRALSPKAWQRLHRALRRVLLQAIRFEGSTLSDGTYRNALNEAGQYQNHHRVYDRAGRRCATCRRADIRRIVQAQRSTFFCPACQCPPRR